MKVTASTALSWLAVSIPPPGRQAGLDRQRAPARRDWLQAHSPDRCRRTQAHRLPWKACASTPAPRRGKVKVGDRATFATCFARLGPSLRGKALDDRLGVATLIELVQHAPAHIDLQAAFTVQEENRAARGTAWLPTPLTPTWQSCWIQPRPMTSPAWDDAKTPAITHAWAAVRRSMSPTAPPSQTPAWCSTWYRRPRPRAFRTRSASPAAAAPMPAPSTSSAPASRAFPFRCLVATITARLRWCVYLTGSIPCPWSRRHYCACNPISLPRRRDHESPDQETRRNNWPFGL